MYHLQIGDQAPDFMGMNQDNELIKLADYAGKKLVLYFYPKDDTPSCTAEACDLRDNYQALLRQGFSILGVSPDTPQSHRKFIDRYQLPFSLIADTDKTIANLYGVWGPKQLFGRLFDGQHRVTFIINAQGIITDIIDQVISRDHAQQLLNAKG